jgi:sulfur carrier protein ThiS
MSNCSPRDDITLKLTRERRESRIIIEEGDRVMDLLKRAGLPVDGVLVFKGNVPIPLDDDRLDVDELTVVTVASGG